MVEQAYNPSTWDNEAGGWSIQGHPGLLKPEEDNKSRTGAISMTDVRTVVL
jgi:hypothetical protein